ncbi:MAG: flagellar biosynthetic protein FliQ [Candidatus Margulisiibacteriota bacterium]|nr:MAG: EscS/YscS/HrcS family type III secretion system export apparatus protein [Candidatus Margulisbacteria bacterium GWD2_39_127]OGI05200.1 MAG: EscS/YscS/HrcS family type III secretion system export apparatus protein [Candidatus Margulisbacteria bacterium GWF2_38_17]OGI06249.1 MAG: EscS/YscS/HrcS family type III secretion system export apparatus protein [Candidatus Margulisbacteria bacterium GWE2_39_32]PZM78905.1 MAG: flagellar biosynthetic protein FliQ [Candidatus Margulisiibacteriota bacte
MNQDIVIGIAQEAAYTALMLSAPALVTGLIVGLLISIFQAVTQIQDATLTFVPKLIVVGITVLVLSGWMLTVITDFTAKIFTNLYYFAM